MSSDPVTSEPQQRGERSSHTRSVADFIANVELLAPQPGAGTAEQHPLSTSLTLLDWQV